MKHSVLILIPCFDLALARKKKLFRSNVCIDNRQCKSQSCASVCATTDHVCIEPGWFYERHGMQVPECVGLSDEGVIEYKEISNFNERQLGDTCAVSINCVSEHCVPECDTSNPVWRCIQSRAFFDNHNIESPRCVNQELFNLAKELDIGENPDKEGIVKSIREITSGRKTPLEGPPNEPIPVQQSPPEAKRESQSNEAPQEKPSLRGQVNDLGINEQEGQFPREQEMPPNELENQFPREQEMLPNEHENQMPREQEMPPNEHENQMPREQEIPPNMQGNQMPREQVMEQIAQENKSPREQVIDQDVLPKEEENQVPHEQGMDQNVRPEEKEIEQKPVSYELVSPSFELQENDLKDNEAKQDQPAGEVEKAPETSIDYSGDSEQASDEARDTPKTEDSGSEVNMLERLVSEYNSR